MELLSPAGNLQKLKYAISFGANAVYTAGKDFGLRAKSENLSKAELEKAVEFCHKKNKKIYVTVNIFAHNSDLEKLPSYLKFLQKINVDAIIVSDPAVFLTARENAPELPIHISTQANVISWKSAEFWKMQGAKRIILARELTFSEIKDIREKIPDIELEMFIHGSMCVSYSGRCFLSSFLNARSANSGYCTQPCRWEYQLIEKSRPNEFFRIEEDKYGSYILNSKDLCLINRLPEINKIGIDSVKIEGRMKSLYYVANVTRIYKEALQDAGSDISSQKMKIFNDELNKISHRHYTEAFFDKFDSTATQYYDSSTYIRDYQFIGEIVKTKNNSVFISSRAKFQLGDEIEFIFPNRKEDFLWKVNNIFNDEGIPISSTKPNTVVKIEPDQKIPSHGIIRKKTSDK